jgi:hypothetical protein
VRYWKTPVPDDTFRHKAAQVLWCKLKGKTMWERLEPVGVQWGNDPWSFPAVPKADTVPIVQSVLNTKIGTPQHFGCNNRLAGWRPSTRARSSPARPSARCR